MSVRDVWVFSAPGDRDNWVASALVDVPYAAVLQQLSRHRSFSLSVGSSRAMELPLDFEPIWRTQPQGKMFSQGFPSLTQLIIAKSAWRMARAVNCGLSRIMRAAGIHKQHYSLLIKPFSTVPCFITGSTYAWNNFFVLRTSDTAQSDIKAMALELKNAIFSKLDNSPMVLEKPGIYGPYLDEPICDPFVLQCFYGKAGQTADFVKLCTGIARVGRVTTGRHVQENLAGNFAVSWAMNAFSKRHASVFEHHFLWEGKWASRCTPLRIASSVRDILGI